MDRKSKIFVAGHQGMVGSAILRKLQDEGYHHLVYRTREQLDLTHSQEVLSFFAAEEIDYVFLAAAKVGGIVANSDYPVSFIRDNLLIQTHVLEAAHLTNVKKLLFLGSSCIYPKYAPQPLKEEYLLSGKLESTNEPYAIAKIAGIVMCQAYRRQYGNNFISAMPTNLYGPNDNFDLQTSHVIPALIRKMHEAKENKQSTVEIWGTGEPFREFMHVDDLADASIHLMNVYEGNEIVNVGVGEDQKIREIAEIIQSAVGFKGSLSFDSGKPDGTPRKLLDISKLNGLGWKPRIPLQEGIKQTYQWYESQLNSNKFVSHS